MTTLYNVNSLLAAVINRAMDDLKGIGPRCPKRETDRAMAFILGEDCEAYCLELGIDHEAVKERTAALYRRFLEKEEPDGGGKKRPGRPANRLRTTRQRPRKASYRYR